MLRSSREKDTLDLKNHSLRAEEQVQRSQQELHAMTLKL